MNEGERRNAELVDGLLRQGTLTDPTVEAAFRAVPRHLFLPDRPLGDVYRNDPIPTKLRDGYPISASSQPTIMAIMLDQLALEPGQRVLEIGAGTGYNAALIAHVVGEDGRVTTIDIDDDIVEAARAHLDTAGLERVRTACGDGGLGWPDDAPYDRIVLTVGAWDVAPAWWDQLAPGGRLLVPLASRASVQHSLLLEPAGDHLVSRSAYSCGFMPLRGGFGFPSLFARPREEPRLRLWSEAPELDPEGLLAMLAAGGEDRPLGLAAGRREIYEGLATWIALHDARFAEIAAEGDLAAGGLVPTLLARAPSGLATFALVERGGAALLTRVDGAGEGVPPPDDVVPLAVRRFGRGDELAKRLAGLVAEWVAAGRPLDDRLRIQVYRRDGAPAPGPGEAAVDKRWTRLIASWTPA